MTTVTLEKPQKAGEDIEIVCKVRYTVPVNDSDVMMKFVFTADGNDIYTKRQRGAMGKSSCLMDQMKLKDALGKHVRNINGRKVCSHCVHPSLMHPAHASKKMSERYTFMYTM